MEAAELASLKPPSRTERQGLSQGTLDSGGKRPRDGAAKTVVTFQKEGRGHRAQCRGHGQPLVMVMWRREGKWALPGLWPAVVPEGIWTQGLEETRGKQLADTGANFLQMEPTLLTRTGFFMEEGGPLSAYPS